MFRYSYSPDDVASIGHCASTVLPPDVEFGPQFDILKTHLEDCAALLSLRGVENAMTFAHAVPLCAGIDVQESKQKELNERFFTTMADRLKECREENQYYNIARSADAFARALPQDQELFCVLSKHLHRHLNMLEPHEFLRTARGFSQAAFKDARVSHAAAKWIHRNHREFTLGAWDSLLENLKTWGTNKNHLRKLSKLKMAEKSADPELAAA